MSSILEALKKAERQSTTDRGAETPWSAPLPEPSPYRRRRRRWWLPLGVVVIGCACAALFWQGRRPDLPQPAESTVPNQASQSRDVAASPTDRTRTPEIPPEQKQQPSPTSTVVVAAQLKPPTDGGVPVIKETATSTAAMADQSEQQTTSSGLPIVALPRLPQPRQQPAAEKPAPSAAPPAVKPATPPAPEDRTSATPSVQPPPVPKSRQQIASTTAEPVAAAADRSERLQPTPPPEPESPEKNYRNDPRIELQALVWSPDTAARFVVINNRLIKEGGAIDNINVIQINRDDVLLSEGADRWYEEFKIR